MVAFTGPNTNHALNRRDQDDAVANFAGAGSPCECLDHNVSQLRRDHNFDSHFWKIVGAEVTATVDQSWPCLTTCTVGLADCDS